MTAASVDVLADGHLLHPAVLLDRRVIEAVVVASASGTDDGIVPIEIPQSRWADIDGPVHYVGWDGPTDRTFVLVHGLGGSVLSWLAVGPRLAERGRVFALDLIGFGRTPKLERRSRMTDNRELLARFLPEVVGESPVVLCGNSMGGGISMLEAALEPARVEGLVLTDSVFPWVWGTYPAPVVMAGFALYQVPRVGEWLSRRRIRGLEAERAVRLGMRVIAADAARIDDDLVAAHVEQLLRLQDDDDSPTAFLEAARSLMALGRRPRVSSAILDGIRCPVLVIHGRQDRLVPYRFAEVATAPRPAWDLISLDRAGHIPQMETPERWIDAVGRWTDERLAAGDDPAAVAS